MIKLKTILNNMNINESVNPGSKQYVNSQLTDTEIIELSKVFASFPHTRLKPRSPQIQTFFKDIANILGYPTSILDTITYTDGKGYVDKNKMKMNASNALLFKIYKKGSLTMSEYGDLQKSLLRKYSQVAKMYANGNTLGSY